MLEIAVVLIIFMALSLVSRVIGALFYRDFD